jgi:hypothetical protein
MKLKFNWGSGIFIFLIIFFIAIFWFVIFSFNLRQDLVEDDYYPKELKYEEQIQKQENLIELGEEIAVHNDGEFLHFQFPKSQNEDEIIGQILIYRPSDSRLDQSHYIKLDSLNEQKLNTSKFLRGKYILKIAWTYQEKAFYQELTIIF